MRDGFSGPAGKLGPWSSSCVVRDLISRSVHGPNRVTGGPGVGKGTQCARLAQDFDFQHLSVGDLLREETNRPGSPFATFIRESMQSSVIIPAQLTISLLKAKMDTSYTPGKGRFLIDGYPRSMDQALTFEEEVRLTRLSSWLRSFTDTMR